MGHECGDVLDGKFRLERVLGQGGLGVVFAATHLALRRCVALKLLLPEALEHDDLVERFAREARIAVSIRSKHVVQVFDAGRLSSGEPFMAMELLEGEELAKVLSRRGALPIDETLDYVLQACEGLAAAHALGIVHRDVKPANLFLTKESDGQTVLKMLDFGISKRFADSGAELQTGNAVAMGTPAYSAPEQLRSARDANPRSDVWSLGVVLYEALAGHRPFRGVSIADVCADVLTGRPPPLSRSEVPRALANVILRCLERDPGRRFQDVGMLAAALARCGPRELAARADRVKHILAEGSPGRSSATSAVPAAVQPLTPAGRARPSAPSKLGFVALLLAVFAAAAFAVSWFAGPRSTRPTEVARLRPAKLPTWSSHPWSSAARAAAGPTAAAAPKAFPSAPVAASPQTAASSSPARRESRPVSKSAEPAVSSNFTPAAASPERPSIVRDKDKRKGDDPTDLVLF